MFRIIDGVLFEGKLVPNSWDVRVWEVNGHRELSARNPVVWEERGAVCDVDGLGNKLESEPLTPAEEAALERERKERKQRQSAERAKTMCRRVIKAEGFDELLTLTYRDNQGDRALCKVHFKEWVRRMKRALPGFRYCASFERQERGAMHVHLATHKLPKHAQFKGVKIAAWRLGTEVWRSIVGGDNGLCFVGGKTRHGGYRRNLSLAKMAAYVSKYILKDWKDVPEEVNRYSRSNGNTLPKSTVMRLHGVSLGELISVAFECGEGDVVVSHHADEFNGRYWLCTERDRGRAEATNDAVEGGVLSA